MQTSIAIIIPSLNSPTIDRVLVAIENQLDADKLDEILVVGKDDMKLIPSSSRARLIDTGQPVTPGEARNIGIEASNADLLIFLDSDCLPQPGWLSEHIAGQEAGHMVLSGGVLPAGTSYWQLSYNLTLFHDYLTTNHPGKRHFLPTLNLSVARQIFDTVGLFDPKMRRGEDVAWSANVRRSGQELYFQPSARVYHDHSRDTLQAVWKDCADSGFFMRQVRLNNPDLMQAPLFLQHRHLLILLSPLIAIWVTLNIIIQKPTILQKFAETLPAIYLTKIAWCLGASRQN